MLNSNALFFATNSSCNVRLLKYIPVRPGPIVAIGKILVFPLSGAGAVACSCIANVASTSTNLLVAVKINGFGFTVLVIVPPRGKKPR